MLLHFFPTGMLGLGLTALLASFMSGMAGNVTAFNTVWTYDIYQSYIHKNGTDAHYLWMGRMATIGGVALSIGAAYFVTSFNNIMDALQLVFSFVNAPLAGDISAGHVLEAHHRPRRVLGIAIGHLRGGAAYRADAARGCFRRRHSRWMDRGAARVSQHHGANFLDSDLGLRASAS